METLHLPEENIIPSNFQSLNYVEVKSRFNSMKNQLYALHNHYSQNLNQLETCYQQFATEASEVTEVLVQELRDNLTRNLNNARKQFQGAKIELELLKGKAQNYLEKVKECKASSNPANLLQKQQFLHRASQLNEEIQITGHKPIMPKYEMRVGSIRSNIPALFKFQICPKEIYEAKNKVEGWKLIGPKQSEKILFLYTSLGVTLVPLSLVGEVIPDDCACLILPDNSLIISGGTYNHRNLSKVWHVCVQQLKATVDFLPHMVFRRSSHCIVYFDNTLYAISGYGPSLLEPRKECEKLVLGGRYVWSDISSIPIPVAKAASSVAYNKIFVFGGRDPTGNDSDNLQMYDIQFDI